jgi:hypothetical protein
MLATMALSEAELDPAEVWSVDEPTPAWTAGAAAFVAPPDVSAAPLLEKTDRAAR